MDIRASSLLSRLPLSEPCSGICLQSATGPTLSRHVLLYSELTTINEAPSLCAMSVAVGDLKISTCEMHAGGEPLRIVVSGMPVLTGATLMQKRNFFRQNYDWFRKFLMNEPRGHYDMYGAVRVPPDMENADVAFLFMHNEGYSTMCGHAIIALGRYCVDRQLVVPTEPETLVNIQCPCGLVRTYVSFRGGLSGSVRFHSVPSFLFASGIEVYLPNLDTTVKVDIAYGGAFYAFVSSDELQVEIGVGKCRTSVAIAQSITDATRQIISLEHPDSAELAFLYGTIIVDRTEMNSNGLIRQMTVFADAELDRSPTGSGVSAHVALLVASGKLRLHDEKIFESAVNGSRDELAFCQLDRAQRFGAAGTHATADKPVVVRFTRLMGSILQQILTLLVKPNI